MDATNTLKKSQTFTHLSYHIKNSQRDFGVRVWVSLWNGGSYMTACLDAIRKYFDMRNEAWVDGRPDSLQSFVADGRRQPSVEAQVTQSILCERRAMAARKTPPVRAHTKIKVQPLTGEERGKADSVYLIREYVTWVYQDGLDYRVEARVIWHRQHWTTVGGKWKLVDAWESDETNLTPHRLTDLVEREAPPGSVPETSPKCVEYDRFRAFRYAELWWNGWNPNFPRLRDDCTNFVSQCLFAGRIPMEKRGSRAEGWWIEIGSKPESERWSYSWAVTEAFRRYLISSLKAKRVRHAEELRIGDVIVYDWAGSGQVHHAAIVSDFDDHGDPLVNAHTNPSYHRHYRYLDSPAWSPRTRYEFLHLPDKLC